MPLIQGASKKTCNYNYQELLHSGRPHDQAYAIMAQIARKNMHKVTMKRQRQILDGELL